MLKYRVGIGYDIHKLVENRKLILGGVEIPFEKGLLGHSDADVLIHAIIDSMLGALGLDDIGALFPDTDLKYKDVSSVVLLKEVFEIIKSKGYRINNLDSNIIAQAPKLRPYIVEIRANLCKILECENISVKAKTNEKMDAVGEMRAIEANAVVMLYLE
ncbi:2-C-methyl-D-erythritol 2,4-cyclodiphosphate synthase [bacterium]|nr:2-C-methyl-D-erythritol 2,4-cyclodiphosphate synthase [bacterium]